LQIRQAEGLRRSEAGSRGRQKGQRHGFGKAKRKARGQGLCSGGLDSMLAGLVLREQDIEIEWVSFETPFFSLVKARKASRLTGIPLTVKPIFADYIVMLHHPPAGYGKQMNPCMDCHALMFRLAGELMREKGFDFLFSGEVLGQRPMSQTKPSLRYSASATIRHRPAAACSRTRDSAWGGGISSPISRMLCAG
jgi:adenylyl- and sulfurtransferase ThiI